MSGAAEEAVASPGSKPKYLTTEVMERLKDDAKAIGFLLSASSGNTVNENGDARWLYAPIKAWQLHTFIKDYKRRFRSQSGEKPLSNRRIIQLGLEQKAIQFENYDSASRAYRREIYLQAHPDKRTLKNALPERIERALAVLVRSRARENMPMTDKQVLHFATCLRKMYLSDRLRAQCRISKGWVKLFNKR